MTVLRLEPRTTPAASVSELAGGGWRLSIPAGGDGAYRLAQLDDYAGLARRNLLWRAPLTLELRVRVSGNSLPGTWGFGLWNDPFAFSLGLQGMARRLPTLPNACWFFHASAENWLSFDENVGNGFLAQSFRAPHWGGMPAGGARALAGSIIGGAAQRVSVDASQWHVYRLDWRENRTEWAIDGETVLHSGISPKGPLGLVIWIDNQFASWRAREGLKSGVLAGGAAWLEVEGLVIRNQ
jgi:hypothetical protein